MSTEQPEIVVKQEEETTREPSQEIVITKKPTKVSSKKSSVKNYRVAIGSSLISVDKSNPKSATSSAVRSVIKQIPLRTPVKVWTKSKSRIHAFDVTRDYDNAKHKRFTVARSFPSKGVSQITPEDGVPASLM